MRMEARIKRERRTEEGGREGQGWGGSDAMVSSCRRVDQAS